MHHEPCWWAPKRNRAHFLSNHILADKAEHMQTLDTHAMICMIKSKTKLGFFQTQSTKASWKAAQVSLIDDQSLKLSLLCRSEFKNTTYTLEYFKFLLIEENNL